MILEVKVKPNSKVEQFDFDKGVLTLKIKEKPVEGKANKAVVDKLAKRLKVAKSCIEIVKGEKSRSKLVRIDCLDDDEILLRLGG
ncbi:DUF167 domain-containing protein [Hippea maritima]|uniref:UPF0235 protein Hipma_1220 n=1 Tax=Hippea maritima (strain ATCC 700847 / DSM 10411 / MH2) TaxID=760142 RepID=F2LWZ8_HIPMA|nr:DUF167 domain-containing protein [Hippea maritima]AEA34182.1 UPF0235 protein yggU [Hippea maritima DSM 10411]